MDDKKPIEVWIAVDQKTGFISSQAFKTIEEVKRLYPAEMHWKPVKFREVIE